MTAIRPGRERPPPENENPGAAPAAPGQSRTQRQDKARKAILQGSSTAAAPNWKQIAEEAWSAPSWKVAALEYHEARQRSGGTPQPPDLTAPRSTRFDPEAYCDTCGSRPCANPTFCLACREADMRARKQPPNAKLERLRQLLDDSVSLERAWHELNTFKDRAAASTVEALMFGLRDGIDALPTNADRLRRLSELSETQMDEVCSRLQNFKPAIARPWTADEVAALVRIWAKIHA